MRHRPRTTPGARPAASRTITVVLSVVAALLGALAVVGPTEATGAPVADGRVTSGHHWDPAPHADDVCDTACTARAATRHAPRSEPTGPRGDSTPGTDGTYAATRRPTQYPATAGHLPGSQPYQSPDRGRAPPAPSGT